MSSTREFALVTHSGRNDSIELARGIVTRLTAAGVCVSVPDEELDMFPDGAVRPLPVPMDDPDVPATPDDHRPEVVIVLGGDGTFLRAARYARPYGAAMTGVNLGHVGFLAETEPEMIDTVVDRLLAGAYSVQERMTLDIDVFDPARPHAKQRTWALNEASLERTQRERILEVAIGVDGHPVTSFGCDGVLCSTPTGSTAYAFSAGGPVMWPQVEAMLIVPNAAHALFARPLVVAPSSVVSVDVADRGQDALLAADGRRVLDVPAGHRVVVRAGRQPIRIARLTDADFAGRLVAKFHLPTTGFRDS
ncbi:NAD kinase [Cumulibacter manganitolerans]|uniref:NAD kinase n=1 Tax=Cumulibacter manganitolerans TaxID=1884992 RepID=UPI001297653A|nr:NAD kinase [Cumulibacter manganitolerans]